MSQDTDNEIICPCGLEMDDHDTSGAEHGYSRGDYKRKDGDIECDCCRPYFWDCQEVFDELDNYCQRDMSEHVGAAIEALGYTLEYDNHIIIKISGDAGVIYEAEEGIYMEFDTLPADIRRACLQVRYDDLVGLSESHEVPAEDIKKAKDELDKVA